MVGTDDTSEWSDLGREMKTITRRNWSLSTVLGLDNLRQNKTKQNITRNFNLSLLFFWRGSDFVCVVVLAAYMSAPSV